MSKTYRGRERDRAKNPPECRAFRRHDDAIIGAFALAGIIFALFCIALFC